MADPWREMAATMRTAIDAIADTGVVVAGQTGGINTWDQFLTTFSSVIGGNQVVAGFRIVEPPGEAAVGTTGEVLSGGLLQDTFRFSIEGFRMIGEDSSASQTAFRDVVWEVKKALDAIYRFTVAEPTIERIDSWPTNQARIMPMLFGQVECWGCTLTKQARALRTVTLA